MGSVNLASIFSALANAARQSKNEGRKPDPAMPDTVRSGSEMERVIRSTGDIDDRVVAAMMSVPRHEFVLARDVRNAYDNRALSIGKGQTISQPSLVAHMISELKLSREATRVLDLGAGSGYQSAILSLLAETVIAVERIPSLAESASNRLSTLGYSNVEVKLARDDVLGFPECAPYDAIIVGASAPEVPPSLIAQLAPGARLVMPVGRSRPQRLATVTRTHKGNGFKTRLGVEVVFVPLIGPEAW